MALIPKRRLGDVLIDCNLITDKQLSEALKEQKKAGIRLGQALIDLKFVTNDDIIWALGDQLNISYIHLTDQLIDFEMARSFPEKLIRNHHFLPIFKLGNELTIVMADPLDGDALNVIESLTELDIKIAISASDEINSYIDKIFGSNVDNENSLADFSKILFQAPNLDLGEVKKIFKALSVEKTLILILKDALSMGSANVSLEPRKSALHIKYRISGKIMRRLSMPREAFDAFTEVLLNRTTDGSLDNREILKIGNDADTSLTIRVNLLDTLYGRAVSLDIITDLNGPELHLKNLGFVSRDLKNIKNALNEPSGLFLITGPAFNGKSTTLTSILKSMPYSEMKIIICTDEGLYDNEGVFLIVKGTDLESVRLANEHDADVIAVTNVKSPEIFRSLIDMSAQRKVIATINLFDFTEIALYLEKNGILKKMFINAARLIINQRLVNLLCPDCSEEKLVPREFIDLLGNDEIINIYNAKGCKKCDRQKYKGCTGIFEVLYLDIFKRCLLLKDPGLLTDIYLNSDTFGLTSLKDSAIKLALKGKLDLNELIKVL
jgi:type IV pilus assembly protein PilB